jgi:hypothetical protein
MPERKCTRSGRREGGGGREGRMRGVHEKEREEREREKEREREREGEREREIETLMKDADNLTAFIVHHFAGDRVPNTGDSHATCHKFSKVSALVRSLYESECTEFFFFENLYR